ncbi:LamG domain-containing protein [Rhodoferax aquaticus]|uniref:LamG domain-containing protein n=2 Tax=Rhodoferax aquaticus TaxID=2527691 RepID=A0A515EWC6_9BURK|nr:LamG domain-containing protein [Rhodoferax aquaticus]
MKLASGALRFTMSDNTTPNAIVSTAQTSTNYSFASGTWQHIAITWSFSAGTNQTVQQIIVNGALATTTGSTPFRSTTSGVIAGLSTLYVGDNRTSGVTPSNGTPNSANGIVDEVYIYPTEINASQAAADRSLTRTTCTSLDHFHILHGGETVNCGGAAASVTITAHDSAHAPISLAGTTLNLATSTGRGTWSNINAINPVNTTGAANSGTATYVFSGESRVVLGLANTVSESVNVNLSSGGVTERSGTASSCTVQDYTYGSSCDADLSFVDAGYLFNVPNHVAETLQTVAFKAVKKSDSSTACVPTFANQTRSITFTCSYQTPATGSRPVRIGGSALNSGASASAACDSTGQSLSLSFDSAGSASLAVQYADVGRVTLNASETTAGVTMAGTDTFVAAPASFAISGVTASPIKAGADFSATVSARNSAGVTTPNFGNETPKETATLSFTKYQPTGSASSNGVFSGALGSFVGGSASASNLSWTEVGSLDLTASLTSGSYLGSGLTATGTTGSTGAGGRFIPNHFDTLLTQGCAAGAYTYSGQAFAVQVVARNKAGNTTVNYDGSANTSPNFAKAVALSDANSAAGTMASNSLAAGAFTAGVASASPVFTFATKQTVPASIKVRATETAADSVSSAPGSEGLAALRSGRVRLGNAYGSELLDLPVSLRAEYWGGSTSGWLLNTADSCSTTVLQFTPVGTDITASTCVRDAVNYSGKGCSGAVPVSNRSFLEGGVVGTDSNGVAGFAGNFNLWLKAPGAGRSGSIDISATVPSWLQFDWKGAGPANPTARATFGVYKSPLIYRRENY